MTTAMAVAAVLAFSFAIGSLARYVDGATLRRWRLSRRWDVPRLAREFITAADEPLATLRGLTHMINAWERGARRPSERYWLLYLRLFPECVTGETLSGSADEAQEVAGAVEIDATVTAPFSPVPTVDQDDIRTLAATVRALEQQIAGLSRRLEMLSRGQHGDGQSRRTSESKKAIARYRRSSTTHLWLTLLPSL